MFLKILCRYKQIFRPDYTKSKFIQNKLYTLDTILKNKALVKTKELTDNLLIESLYSGINKPFSISKQYRLFQKLGIRSCT